MCSLRIKIKAAAAHTHTRHLYVHHYSYPWNTNVVYTFIIATHAWRNVNVMLALWNSDWEKKSEQTNCLNEMRKKERARHVRGLVREREKEMIENRRCEKKCAIEQRCKVFIYLFHVYIHLLTWFYFVLFHLNEWIISIHFFLFVRLNKKLLNTKHFHSD